MSLLVSKLRGLHVDLTLVDGKLKLRAPEGILTGELLEEIKQNKDELTEFLRQASRKQGVYPPLEKAIEKTFYPLSSAQNRLFFLYALAPESLSYNVPQVLRLEGRLDVDKLNTTFRKLVDRHEILRTSFEVIDGLPVQRVHSMPDVTIQMITDVVETEGEIVKSFIKPFDLSKAPLIRAGLVQRSVNDHLLILDMHHISTDGVSREMLVKDFMSIYNGEELVSLKFQYKDYAEWQQSKSFQQSINLQKEYWLNEFADEPTALSLPSDQSDMPENIMAGKREFVFNRTTSAALQELARTCGVSMNMLLFSAYSMLINKLSGQEDLVIGIPIAGRPLAELESIMGMFINMLPIRTTLKGNLSFRDYLSTVRNKIILSVENQMYPYEALVDQLNPERSIDRNSIFNTIFSFENFERPSLEIPGLKIKLLDDVVLETKYDLMMSAYVKDEQFHFVLTYSRKTFLDETADRFVQYFNTIIQSVLTNPGIALHEVDILSIEEKEKILKHFNRTDTQWGTGLSVLDLIYKQVRNNPTAIAITQRNGTTYKNITYEELDKKSNQVSRWLSDKGIGYNDIVSISSNGSVEVIILILGILKSRAAYIPTDPKWPVERLIRILNEGKPKYCFAPQLHKERIVKEGNHLIEIPDFNLQDNLISLEEIDQAISSFSSDPIITTTSENDRAYIIYTSGSTGKPKGVELIHRGLLNLTLSINRDFEIDNKDSIVQFTSMSFDISVMEIFCCLIAGARLVIFDRGQDVSIDELYQLMRDQRVTIGFFPPSILRFLNSDLPDLRIALSGGEPCDMKIMERWKKGRVFINGYGPTEYTVATTLFFIKDKDALPSVMAIGKPLANTKAYILGPHNELRPIGVPGELCIAGYGMAKGYLNNEAATKEKFIANPFSPGDIIYRTGDLAKWLPDGNIVCLGRIDNQIKLRGFRIELGEIESHLTIHEHVKEAVVLLHNRNDSKYLVAYYVATAQLSEQDLKNYLATRLPDYMIPTLFIPLPNLPLNSSGKLNRKALLEIKLPDITDYSEPTNKNEQVLVKVWQNVLGRDRIGINDNFFLCGGDSIKSIQISSRLRAEGYEITLKDIFTCQTIKELALKLKDTRTVIDQAEVIGTCISTPIQRWFLNSQFKKKEHFNQSVTLNFFNGIQSGDVQKIFAKIQSHHDALRIFLKDEKQMLFDHGNIGTEISLEEYDLKNSPDPFKDLLLLSNKIQSNICLDKGPLMRLGLFHMSEGSRLLIVIHHLVVDAMSWRILFEDIETLKRQIDGNEQLILPAKTTSFKDWSSALMNYRNGVDHQKAMTFWDGQNSDNLKIMHRDFPEGTNRYSQEKTETIFLDADLSSRLLGDVHKAFNTQINDLLITGLMMAICEYYDSQEIHIDTEGHGREQIQEGLDLSRTVGWFTTIYPLSLHLGPNEDLGTIIKKTKSNLSAIPNKGLDYLLDKSDSKTHSPILFNYLGQFDTDIQGKSYSVSTSANGYEIDQDEFRLYDWEITGIITNKQLRIDLKYSDGQYNKETISHIQSLFKEKLEAIIDYCLSRQQQELTIDDLTCKILTSGELEHLNSQFEISDAYPLSPMQEGMFFQSLLDGQSDEYFQQVSYRLEGDLDLDIASQSLNRMVEQYDVLRTVFLYEGYQRPIQLVLKNMNAACIYKDLRLACESENRDKVIDEYRFHDRKNKFNLNVGPLIRLHILQTGIREFELIWSHHHIIMDGWCMSVLAKSFQQNYLSLLKNRPINSGTDKGYGKYIDWLEKRKGVDSATYWSNYLKGYTHTASFPRKNSSSGDYKLQIEQINLRGDRKNKLELLAAEQRITLNTLIEVCWGILLAKYNNTSDVVFGKVVSGRPPEIADIEKVVGLFINTIPARITYSSQDTIEDLFKNIQKESIEAEPHHYIGLPTVQALHPLGNRLIDHVMVFENYPISEEIEATSPSVLRATNIHVFEQTNYDCCLTIMPGTELKIQLEFNENAYDNETIRGVLHHFDYILDQITIPQLLVRDISLMTPDEQQQLLINMNGPLTKTKPTKTFIDVFEQQVNWFPNHVALNQGSKLFTYTDLDILTNQIANYLLDRGLIHGEIVAIALDRSTDLIAWMIGIMKAGGIFTAIDTRNPANRIQKIILSCKPRFVVTIPQLADLIGNGIDEKISKIYINDSQPVAVQFENYSSSKPVLSKKITVDEIAYIAYTSGSSGEPKGVLLHHGGMINHFQVMSSLMELTSQDCFAQTAETSFDVYVMQALIALSVGGRTSILSRDEVLDPALLEMAIRKENINVIELVPSIIEALLSAKTGHLLNQLRWLISTGEPITKKLARKWYSIYPEITILNAYGPAETSDDATAYIIPREINDDLNAIPIGRPLSNFAIYISSHEGQLCPIGVNGEISISGIGVGLGYINNEKETAARFIENPFQLNRHHRVLYKTGDMGYWNSDGNITCIGRYDSMVKVRGARVELGEVERAIQSIKGIKDVVVLAWGEENNLCAYFTTDKSLNPNKVRKQLSSMIPLYMMPLWLMPLESFPSTVNGKVDRNGFPAPDFTSDVQVIEPTNERQAILRQLWSEVLNHEAHTISIQQNFFELGGHSLKATLLANLIKRKFDVEIPLKELFDRPTIELQAEFVETILWLMDDNSVNENEEFELSL